MNQSGLLKWVRAWRLEILFLRRAGETAILVGIGLALASGRLFGQANVGSVVGNVSDISGAAISGAKVTLTNPATSETPRQIQFGLKFYW